MQADVPLYTVFYLGLMMGLFFLCFAHDARSQVTSEKGWIIASANTGCADLSISITHQRSGVGELQFSFEGDINDPIASDVGEPVGVRLNSVKRKHIHMNLLEISLFSFLIKPMV